MRVSCPACMAAYEVDEGRLPPEGLELQCSSCGGVFAVPPPRRGGAGAIPLPGSAPAGAVVPTSSGAIPLPGAAARPPAPPVPVGGSIPLPGSAAARPLVPAAPAGGSIPLPGSAPAWPPPPPAPSEPAFGAIPLPGADAAAGGAFSPPAAPGALPLPGTEAAPPPDLFGSLDFGDPFALSAPGSDGFDFGEGGLAEGTSDVSFATPPPRLFAGTEPSAPLSPEGLFGGTDPSLPPPPPLSPEGLFGGTDPSLPPPPPLSPEGLFGGMEPSAPPPPPLSPESLFGDIDAPSSAPLPDLEITLPPRMAAPASAPLPDLEITLPPRMAAPVAAAAAQATSALLRDFLQDDETAPAPAAAPPPPTRGGPPTPMFHVRRKSGKRIGPFDEETLVRMVRQDLLDGTEDVSTDGEVWAPLADVPDVRTLLSNRPPPKPRVAVMVAPVLQRGVVVEEPAPPAPVAAPAEAVDAPAAARRLPSRKVLGIAGGAVLGVALLAGGATFLLGGEAEAPPVDPAVAAADAGRQGDEKVREEKRAAAKKALDGAEAALRNGEAEEARRLLAEALAPDAAVHLDKKLRAAGLLLEGELARLERKAGDAEKAFRKAAAEGSGAALAALGRLLLSRHQASDAIEALEGASDPETLVLLVRAHLDAGSVPGAEAVLQPLEKKGAKELPLALLRGLVLEESGKKEEALAAFEKAAAEKPARTTAQVVLARARLESGDPAKENAAVEWIEAVFAPAEPDAQDPFTKGERAQLQLALGGHRLSKGEIDAARKAFERAATLDPTEARATAARGSALLAAGNRDGARAAFDEALAIDDACVEALAGLGTLALQDRDAQAALVHLEKAHALTPRASAVGALLAQALLDAGRLPDAMRTIDSVIERDGTLAQAHGVRAAILLAQKDTVGAVSEARRAATLEKSEARWHLLLGKIHDAAGAPGLALASYREALALAPGDTDALEGVGRAQLAQGGFQEGIKSLEAALAKDPSRTNLLETIADGYLRTRKFQQAIDTIERQRRLTGAKGLSFKLGRALQEQGRTDQAIAQLQRAIVEEPTDGKAHRFLGFAYKEKNQIRKAIEAFQSYLSLTPDADDRAEIEDEIATLRF